MKRAVSRVDSTIQPKNTIESVETGEQIIAIINKHPFGILKSYVFGLLALISALIILYLAIVYDEPSDSNIFTFRTISIILSLLLGLFLIVMTVIYNQTKLIISNENLIKISQIGLFFRHSSQVFLADIEDVSSIQKGFFANNFGFGTLKAETESQQKNFMFSYCPKIQHYAKIIVDAKENYMKQAQNSFINTKNVSD